MFSLRTLLIILTLIALGLSFVSYADLKVRERLETERSIAEEERARANGDLVFIDFEPDFQREKTLHVGISLLIGFLLISMLGFKRLSWSLPLSVIAILPFPYWYWRTQQDYAMTEGFPIEPGLNSYLYRGGTYDVLVFLVLLLIAGIRLSLAFNHFRRYRVLIGSNSRLD